MNGLRDPRFDYLYFRLAEFCDPFNPNEFDLALLNALAERAGILPALGATIAA